MAVLFLLVSAYGLRPHRLLILIPIPRLSSSAAALLQFEHALIQIFFFLVYAVHSTIGIGIARLVKPARL